MNQPNLLSSRRCRREAELLSGLPLPQAVKSSSSTDNSLFGFDWSLPAGGLSEVPKGRYDPLLPDVLPSFDFARAAPIELQRTPLPAIPKKNETSVTHMSEVHMKLLTRHSWIDAPAPSSELQEGEDEEDRLIRLLQAQIEMLQQENKQWILTFSDLWRQCRPDLQLRQVVSRLKKNNSTQLPLIPLPRTHIPTPPASKLMNKGSDGGLG